MSENPINPSDKNQNPNSNESTKKYSPMVIFFGVVAAVIGQYGGFSALIPIIFIGLSFSLFTKILFRNKDLIFLESSALLSGHAAWMIVGSIVLSMTSKRPETSFTVLTIFEAIVYISSSYFLLRNPNFILGWILIFLEIITLIINIFDILQFNWFSDQHRAITIHLSIRIAIILTIFFGLKRLQKSLKRKDEEQSLKIESKDQI